MGGRCLVHALTGPVPIARFHMSGNPTCQDLVAVARKFYVLY
jgi:hypothetical protein